jgi:hypothetical protein
LFSSKRCRDEFKWDLNKWNSEDVYKIVDKGNNVLRSNNLGSALYLANLDWTDDRNLFQYYSLNSAARTYANYLYLIKKTKNENSQNAYMEDNKTMYDMMKQYFRRKLFKNQESSCPTTEKN